MGWVREALKVALPPKLMDAALHINRNHLMSFKRPTYSLEGEDVLLAIIFLAKTSPGFYVDVGAYHPVSSSNTYLFYKRGWRGINIDPVPGTSRLFKKRRPRDINLEIGISDSPTTLNYYMFDSASQNTFDEGQCRFALEQGRKLLKTVPVQVERLETVLDRHVPKGTNIDFMTVDVEGHEIRVLASNDWKRFRPSIVCMEMNMVRAEEVPESPTGRFLVNQGYRFLAKLRDSVFFQERDFCFCDRDFADRYGTPHAGMVHNGRTMVRVHPT